MPYNTMFHDFLLIQIIINIFAFANKKIIQDMTTMQLNAEMLRNMSIIAEDENLLNRATKYLRKLVDEKMSDPTLLSKEDFFHRIDEAKKGPTYELKEGETLEDLIDRVE